MEIFLVTHLNLAREGRGVLFAPSSCQVSRNCIELLVVDQPEKIFEICNLPTFKNNY